MVATAESPTSSLLPAPPNNAEKNAGVRRRWMAPVLRQASDQLFVPLVNGDGVPAELNVSRTLGTFGGVYVPVVNSVFGVVVFLRWGWAVGQAGIGQVFIMLAAGALIALITAAATSALATNGTVAVGGPYYLISRALGPEFGGAIGLLFFFANGCSVAFYLLGNAETLVELLASSPVNQYLPCEALVTCSASRYWDNALLGSLALMLITVIALIGADCFARASNFIFVIVMASVLAALASIVGYTFSDAKPIAGFEGWNVDRLKTNFGPQYICEQSDCEGETVDFFFVLGVVTPAVTGLLSGANMSGNLKDPAKAIPIGTFAGVITMLIVYSACIILLGGAFERTELRSNYFVFQERCFSPQLVFAGTLLATISPALSQLCGMARIFQAMAKDSLFGKTISGIFAKGFGAGNEPRYAVLGSWFVCQCVVLIGDVNAIAKIVTVSFIVTYAALNLACCTMVLTRAPNWRPLFKLFDWKSSAFGVVLCLGLCMAVDLWLSLLCLLLATVFFIMFALIDPASKDNREFADVSQALMHQWVLHYLLKLDMRKSHVKHWRPNVLLVLDQQPSSGDAVLESWEKDLIQIADELRSTGVLVVGHVLEGDIATAGPNHAGSVRDCLDSIERAQALALPISTVSSSFPEGVQSMLCCAGMGNIRPNTLMLPFEEPAELALSPLRCLRLKSAMKSAFVLGNSVVLATGFRGGAGVKDRVLRKLFPDGKIPRLDFRLDISKHGPRAGMTIDVWLTGFNSLRGIGVEVTQSFGGVLPSQYEAQVLVMLQLAFLLHMHRFWSRTTRLRVMLPVPDGDAGAQYKARLGQIMAAARIHADIVCLSQTDMLQSTAADNASIGLESFIKLTPTQRNAMLNAVIREHSESTGLVVIYQSRDVAATEAEPAAGATEMVTELATLVQDLPPTLLVYPSAELVTTS